MSQQIPSSQKSILLKQIDQLSENQYVQQVALSSTNSEIKVIYQPTNTNSQYDNCSYRIRIVIPENYPNKAPSLFFQDIIYHLNVNQTSGQVFLSLLQEDWSPFIGLSAIFDVLDEILEQPDINIPWNKNIYRQFKEKYGIYLHKVQNSVQIIQKMNNIPSNNKKQQISFSKQLHEDKQQEQTSIKVQTNTNSSNFQNQIQVKIDTKQQPKKQNVQKANESSIYLNTRHRKPSQQFIKNVVGETANSNSINYLMLDQSMANQQCFMLQNKLRKVNQTLGIFMDECLSLDSKLKTLTHPRLKKLIQEQLDEQLKYVEQLTKISSQIKKILVKKLRDEGNSIIKDISVNSN